MKEDLISTMENREEPVAAQKNTEWYSEDFIYNAVVKHLRENGYKVQKEQAHKEGDKSERIINASKFFKKEIIEVKGFSHAAHIPISLVQSKVKEHAKSWFSEAMLNSFMNFSNFDNAEVAMALPNVGRYQAIIEKLYEYFTVNDLFFRVYMVNEDESVDVSNLNQKFGKISP
jgi:hypothetical protein